MSVNTINNKAATSSGSSVTVGGLSNQTLSDGLVSGYHTSDGGFLISFYRNYSPKTSGYTGSLEGLESGTVGTITSHSNNILTVENISSRFIIGESINMSNIIEKIEKVEYFGTSNNINKATVTLSLGHKSIVMYKYNSSGSIVFSNKQINTLSLEEDENRSDLSLTNYTRNSTIFNFNRPLVNIIESLDNTIVATYTNKIISNVYYQIFSSSGDKIGDETAISSLYSSIKQRNPTIAPLKTLENQEHGFIIAWDNETLDADYSGIFQTQVNPNNHLFYAHNTNSKLSFTNDGRLGLGTNSPNFKLHSISSSNNDIVIETTKNNYTTSDLNTIKFKGNGSTDLAKISSSFSTNYEVLIPKFNNLLAYYNFNELRGSNILNDSSTSKITGTLTNFDVNNCWNEGLINNGLQFNGSNNFVSLDTNTSLKNLAYGSGSGQDFSISCWVKVPSNISTSSNLDVICNDGSLNVVGNYITSISDTGSNGNLKLLSGLTTSGGYFQSVSTTKLNDNNWHLINTVYHNSNVTIQSYIDGVRESSITGSGSVNNNPSATSNTSIGIRSANILPAEMNTQKGYFKGMLDELKIFNASLTFDDIQSIYNLGNKKLGELQFSTQGGLNNLSSPSHGFSLDNDGMVRGLQVKARPFTILSGSSTSTTSSDTITGTNSFFDNELELGDTINFSSSTLTVKEITSQSSIVVNQNPSESTTSSVVIRKPAITTFLDQESNIKSLINHEGNMIIGGIVPSTKLHLTGTGDTNDLPYLTLENTKTENTDNGRETKINFTGYNSSTLHTLGSIEMSHDGTSSDTKSHLKFFTNDGSNLVNNFNIKSNSNVGVGVNNTSPLGVLHLKESQNPSKLIIESGQISNKIFGEQNNMYFIGTTSRGNNSNLEAAALSKITGSSDSTDTSSTGRLDFFVNNPSNGLGLQSSLSLLSSGYVGCSINKPVNILQASPKLNLNTNYTASQSGTNVTLESGSTVPSNRQYDIVNGYIIYNNDSQTMKKITGWTNSTTLTVEGSESISSTNASLYYPGLNVDTNGNVAVGVSTISSKFHIEGPISTAFKTVTSNYDITNTDSTIIGNGSSVTVRLTTVNTIKGRKYIIKNINSNNLTVSTEGSQTIDGANTKTLSQYKFVEVQSDGTNWLIIGTNL